jgi:O-antigen ligase
MLNTSSGLRLPFALLLGCLLAVGTIVYRPGYLVSADFLGLLICAQLFAAILWSYATRFFSFLMIAFLGPALILPLQGLWTSGRWVALAVGALVGLVIYMKDRQHSFGAFHVAAFFCVVAAVISAQMSTYSGQALLKASSLFLLFLYGATGARLAANGRTAQFSSRLLLGCELLVYCAAAAYFVIHHELFGNPNSLGALMGVAIVPITLWGVIVSDNVIARRRRTFALCLALLLLLSSYSRASIASATIACILLCIVARRYKLLVHGAALFIFLAVLVVVVAPPQTEPSTSVPSAFLYKGHQGSGFLGSRTSVWDRTLSTIQEHPWFGTGFGTADATPGAPGAGGMFSSTATTTREHGNSYLAITEGVGIVGLLPFAVLILLLIVNVSRVWLAAWRSRSVRSLAVLFATVLSVGLIHAAFEDWLFSVGYYLCVFFWSLAFMLVDFMPANDTLPTLASALSLRQLDTFAAIPSPNR